VVTYDAVDALVVVAADSRGEVNFNPDKGMGFHNALQGRESEHIEAVSQELEVYWQVRVVMHRKQTIG
jgi:hypothetical protein